MADELDVEAMIERFRQRAVAVRNRGLPPVEGPERRRIAEQAQMDYMDFAMLGDADGRLENGILKLEIDLRPRQEGGSAARDRGPRGGDRGRGAPPAPGEPAE